MKTNIDQEKFIMEGPVKLSQAEQMTAAPVMLIFKEDPSDSMSPKLTVMNPETQTYPYSISKNMGGETEMMDFAYDEDPDLFARSGFDEHPFMGQNNSNLVTLSNWQDLKGKIFTGHFQYLNYYIEGKIPRTHVNFSLPFDGHPDLKKKVEHLPKKIKLAPLNLI